MNELDWTCRTELLLTADKIKKLNQANILIVGLGGVGGYAAEQIARAGVGKLTLIDSDVVQPSNINRQIIALNSTVGKPKVELVEQRLKDINPEIQITTKRVFVEMENIYNILEEKFDYVIDAIDTLTPKVDLLEACVKTGTPVVSSMGSGARIDPSLIQIADIKNSHHCKLAYLVRKYLHKRGIYEGIKVVFSTEQVPEHALVVTDGSNNKRTIVGTISYLPALFGCYIASVLLRDLMEKD